ncbi:hypothetical protein SCLARK_001502 [Spiroplasma clarkii]|nr:hypothetical protein SCLARK_001502 [Spiroplasma clarkii]
MRERLRPIKILVEGRPGTGKTTFVQYLSLKLKTNTFSVMASSLVSSFLGDTQKILITYYQI